MKKTILISLLIALILMINATVVCATKSNDSNEKAIVLKEMGLFKGVSDTDFDLDRQPTRAEALVMLIRLLGKENEVLSGTYAHPFKDVPEWADKYVGYGYVYGLTNGISKTDFGSNTIANSDMYLTFVLRALGYSDTNNVDFSWDNPETLAKTVGILDNEIDLNLFYRADVVLVSYKSLSAKIKSDDKALYSKLKKDGAIANNNFINIEVEQGTTMYQTTRKYEVNSDAQFKISIVQSDIANKLQYYWDSEGISSKKTVNNSVAAIKLPNNFEEGKTYVLYVSGIDLNGDTTPWYKYTFKIIENDEVTIIVKQNKTTLVAKKSYEYPVNTSLKITVTPSDEIEKIEYYWDVDGYSKRTKVTSYTKTITIPDDFEVDEKYELYIRALDTDGEYTDWKEYDFEINEDNDDTDITINVKQGTTTLSTSKTYYYNNGTSLKIVATPSTDIERIEYYWNVDNIAYRTKVSLSSTTIEIPDEFEEGKEYYLYARALDEDDNYTLWKKYTFEIDEDSSEEEVTLNVKKDSTVLSIDKVYEYVVDTSLKIIATPSSSISKLEYYWDDLESDTKTKVSSYTTTITIPKDFILGKEYVLYVRALKVDGTYTAWKEYTFEIAKVDNNSDGESSATISVKKGSTTLTILKKYEYENGTELTITGSTTSLVSKLEYYWNDKGLNSKQVFDGYTTKITIPNDFVKGEEYRLYVRALDTDGDYTAWYEYIFDIPEDINLQILLRDGTTVLSNSKTLEYEAGYSLNIKVTPSTSVQKIQYAWDTTTTSSLTTVSSNTKTFTIPTTSTFKAGSQHVLNIRVLDANNKYTDFVSYTVKIVVPVKTITLEKTELEMKVGETYAMVATILPSTSTDTTIVWSSTDSSIANVDSNGKIAALAVGEAKIIAVTSNNLTQVCNIVVKEATV